MCASRRKAWTPVAHGRDQVVQPTVVDVHDFELVRLAVWECWRQLNWK